MPRPPKFVALCGYPGSGKTTLAEFLAARYGARLVDDGAVLREACMALYGLSWEDVYTQDGKLRTLTVGGQSYSHRQLCGHLGNLLEGFYGEQFVPEQTLRRLAREADDAPFYVFPSVRKTQGITYRAQGGLVVEVRRPGCTAENDFDRYDESLVTHTILNGRAIAPLFCRRGPVVEAIPEGEFLDKAARLFDGLGYRPLAGRAAA